MARQLWQTVTAWDIQDWHSVSNMTTSEPWDEARGRDRERRGGKTAKCWERAATQRQGISVGGGEVDIKGWGDAAVGGGNLSYVNMMCTSKGCVEENYDALETQQEARPARSDLYFHFKPQTGERHARSEPFL